MTTNDAPKPIYQQQKFWIIAIVAILGYSAFSTASNFIKNSQKNYICSKKTGIKPPNHLANFIFIENGIFTKTCTTSIKKKRYLKGDCGPMISGMVRQGFTCKRTILDLD